MSEHEAIQSGFVESNGTRLYYEVAGSGHPLVLIHGGYMDRRMWDDQFQVFAQRYDFRLFKDAEKLKQEIVGARRAVIAQTHHMPNMERPEEFNAIVLNFLEGLRK